MNSLCQAYLDDYHQITVEIQRKYHDGQCEQFYLVCKDEITPLSCVEKQDEADFVRYNLYCQSLTFGKEYRIAIRENYTCPLQFRYIVKTERFNEEFYYPGNDLGATVKGNKTIFKVWSPFAGEIVLKMNEHFFAMKRGEKGVFETIVERDCTGESYCYLVSVNGTTSYALDPYGKASTPNSELSVVANCSHRLKNAPARALTCPLIMEGSVRDFTKEGTFKAMNEILDDFIALKITHLQLMPVNDFATVNEYHKRVFANWGYDPMQYQCLEGSYSSDINNPLQVNDDFAELVENAHCKGLRIVLDVVFNHHYIALESSFNKLVPYYYFRYENGVLCEGTYCGSEYDSQQSMARKYLLDTLVYYLQEYDVDGFRFDLMNFIDIETMKQAEQICRSIKKEVLLYGEGWNMKAGADADCLCVMDHADRLDSVGFFNDAFRDLLRGSNFNVEDSGYGCGNGNKAEAMIPQLLGLRFNQPMKSVNYVECHDNRTLYDYLCSACKDDNEQQIARRIILINGCVLFSKGLRFIHAGQQFGLTKRGIDNTYNSPDEINSLVNKLVNPVILQGYRDLAEIDEEYRMADSPITYHNDNGVLIGESASLTLVINPFKQPYCYNGKGTLIFDGLQRCQQKTEESMMISSISFAVISHD